MNTEGLRKHTTLLFQGRDAYTSRKWSGLLPNHTNLTNHQLCIVASAVVETGRFAVHILPDGDNIKGSIDTGLQLKLNGANSAVLNFTAVIRGLRLVAVENLPEGVAVSAVLSSFARNRRLERATNQQERYDYVSSVLARGHNSNSASFTANVANHHNLIYHHVMLSAGEATTGQYQVRFIPDVAEQLEASVDTGVVLDLNGTESDYAYFGAIMRGIHLQRVTESSPATPLDIVLSSSAERFDELVYTFIGSDPSVSEGLQDHLNDFNNPHQTSWDNLLNKPLTTSGYTLTREVIELGTQLTIPDEFQYLVWGALDIEGELDVEGKLIILEDHPAADPFSPDFTYNGSGDLMQIDYAQGEQKVFTYDGGGSLIRVDYLVDGTTLRKDFVYGGGGELDYITESYLE